MKHVLYQLDAIERALPAARIDRGKVAVLGHSMGGHTASLLLGARQQESLLEPRIKAGVFLAGPGRGDALSAYAAEHYPIFTAIDFSTMVTPALVVAGDKDASAFLTTAGPSWHADPYHLSPAPKALLTLFGGEHGLGGIAGYDLAETTDEDTARVATVQRLAWAYLRSQLFAGDPAWHDAQNNLQDASIDTK